MSVKFIPLFFLLTLIHFYSFSQKLSFGPVSGIVFSNLRGEIINHTWNAKPGPVNGIFARANLGKQFALKTAAEFTSFYYQERWVQSYYTVSMPFGSSSYFNSYNGFDNYFTYPGNQSNVDLHFLRVPLMLQWNTQGRLNLGFGAGAFYAFLMNDEFTGKDKDLHTEEFRKENFPPGTDWGWLISASINYSINSRLNIFMEGRATYGKEVYIKELDGRNGSSELLFGLGFSPFNDPENIPLVNLSSQKIEIMPHTGVSFSRSVAPDEKQDYAILPALNTGISLKFKHDSAFSVITGLWYEQKGYHIDKPSQSRLFYIPHPLEDKFVSFQSDVSLDYLTIPLLVELSFGGLFTTNIHFGLYYSMLQNARINGEETRKDNFGSGFRVEREYFSQNVEGWFKNDDFGGIAGLRFEYRILPKVDIYTSLQKSLGFLKVADKNKDEKSGAAPEQLHNFINQSLTASVGFIIPLD